MITVERKQSRSRGLFAGEDRGQVYRAPGIRRFSKLANFAPSLGDIGCNFVPRAGSLDSRLDVLRNLFERNKVRAHRGFTRHGSRRVGYVSRLPNDASNPKCGEPRRQYLQWKRKLLKSLFSWRGVSDQVINRNFPPGLPPGCNHQFIDWGGLVPLYCQASYPAHQRINFAE